MVGHRSARDGEPRVRVRGRPPGRPGVQSRPCQSIRCAGTSSVSPSHHTSPSSVSATFVKIVSRRDHRHGGRVGRRAGARRDAEEAGLGVDRAQPPVRAGAAGRIQAMSSPIVSAVQPGSVGVIIARFVLPHADGNAAARWNRRPSGDVSRSSSMCSASQPSSRPIDRGDPQREALLAQQRVAAVARAVRPDLPGLGEVADVLGRAARPGDVVAAARRPRRPAASRRCAPPARSRRRRRGAPGRPCRPGSCVCMDTTTYGESVISTPICASGDPTGPIENGTTYMPGRAWRRRTRPAAARASRPARASCSSVRRRPRARSR